MKTHLSEKRVVVHPREKAQDSDNSFRSRRNFISSAAWAAGAIGMSPLLGSSGTKAEAVTTSGRTRAVQAFEIRRNAALAEFNAPTALHTDNGDEQRYPDRRASLSKTLLQNDLGEVDPDAYQQWLTVIASGDSAQFDNVPRDPRAMERLNNPQATYATVHGTATDAAGAVVPNATVTALNTSTGIKTTVNTNSQGYYTFPQLQIGGPYTISVSAAGFNDFASSGLMLESQLQDVYDLPLDLKVGSDDIEDLMRRIGLVEGEAGTPVSAFNSSI